MKKKQIWIIVAIILGALLVWWLFFSGNQATAPSEPNTEMSEELPGDDPTQPIPAGSATNQLPNSDDIAVLDQQAGSYVTIDNYVLSQPGYVVIHATNSDGSAGAIIGQSGLLQAGPGQDLEIKAAIVAGKTYAAMLHYDDGDKKFVTSSDAPATSEGKPIMTAFDVE